MGSGVCSKALVDTGSTLTFIDHQRALDLQLPISTSQHTVSMASSAKIETTGRVVADLKVFEQIFGNQPILVLPNLFVLYVFIAL